MDTRYYFNELVIISSNLARDMEIVLYFIEVSYIYALTVIFIGTVLTGIGNSMSCLIIKNTVEPF